MGSNSTVSKDTGGGEISVTKIVTSCFQLRPQWLSSEYPWALAVFFDKSYLVKQNIDKPTNKRNRHKRHLSAKNRWNLRTEAICQHMISDSSWPVCKGYVTRADLCVAFVSVRSCRFAVFCLPTLARSFHLSLLLSSSHGSVATQHRDVNRSAERSDYTSWVNMIKATVVRRIRTPGRDAKAIIKHGISLYFRSSSQG